MSVHNQAKATDFKQAKVKLSEFVGIFAHFLFVEVNALFPITLLERERSMGSFTKKLQGKQGQGFSVSWLPHGNCSYFPFKRGRGGVAVGECTSAITI